VSVASTSPAIGSVLSHSLRTITVTFNEPIDPATLSNKDFDLGSLTADGTLTSLSTSGAPILSEPTKLSGPTDTLVLTVNRPLPNGNYILVLIGSATIKGANGDPLANQGITQYVGVISVGAGQNGTTGSLSVVSTDPTDGRAMPHSSVFLTVNFNEPIDPSTLTDGIDFDVERVASNGAVTSLSTPEAPVLAEPPAGEVQPTTLLPLSLNQVLPAGNYELVINPRNSSQLKALDGDSLAYSASTVIAHFTVTRGSVVSVTSTDPADGTSVSKPPKTITVTFNEPINPASISGQDFDVVSIGPDGSRTSLSTIDPSILSEPTDLTGPTNSLVLTVNQTLPNGNYELVLRASATIQGASGDRLGNLIDDAVSRFQVNTTATVSALKVVQTTPGRGARVAQSPTTITVTFNEKFDPTTLTDGGVDFDIVSIGSDGTLIPLGAAPVVSEPPFGQVQGATTLTLTVNQELPAGNYAVVVNPHGTSLLKGLNGDPSAYAGLKIVGRFTVEGRVSVIPTGPAFVNEPPSQLAVSFSEPIDPTTLGTNDFELASVAADGTVTPISAALTEPNTLTDPTTLTLTVNTILSPGAYRLILLGSSTIAGANGDPLSSSGVDQTVTDLTVSYLSVIQTGAVVYDKSPTQLVVNFNEPISAFSLTNQDFDLESVAPDGTATSLSVAYDTLLSEPDDLMDATASLTLTVAPTLPAGHYRLLLLGTSTISGDNGDPLWPNGVDQPVGDFIIQAPSSGTSLADATRIGVIGSTPTTVAGALDFTANPSAVKLYKIDLASGHFWQFGAEISATRDGGTLHTALALFDAQGNLIKESTVGDGGSPNDPYFFAGLKPGTYYLGVSNVNNVPGRAGGYDPRTGTPGSPSTDPLGGPFRLHLVAMPADQPIQLLSGKLVYADPLSQAPTGLELAFSGPLSLSAFQILSMGADFHGLELVDQSGRVWGMTPVGFQNQQSQVSFVFDEHLPAGKYTIRIPDQGGITDLADQTPVATGQSQNVLGSFAIPPATRPRDPNDLGMLTREVHSGIALTAALLPGASTTYRFVVPLTDFYTIDVQSHGGPVGVVLIGPHGPVSLSTDSDVERLTPGVYYLELTNAGSTPETVFTFIRLPATSWETYWDNGLGQAPALNLALVQPTAPTFAGNASLTATPAAADSSGPATGSGTATTSGGTAAPSTTAAPSVPAASVSGPVLTLGNLVGNSSSSTSYVTVVGPGVQPGSTALALTGVGQSLRLALTPPTRSGNGEDDAESTEANNEELESTSGAIPASLLALETSADERVLAESELPTRVGDILSRWFSNESPALAGLASVPIAAPVAETPEPTLVADRVEPEQTVAAETPVTEDVVEEQEEAGIGMPLTVCLATAVVIRLRQPIRRWLDKNRKRTGPPQGFAMGMPHPRG
jgi:methionine-rich copper-binding protein CopC